MVLETAPTIRNTFGLPVRSQALHDVDFATDLPRAMRDIQRRKQSWCVIGDASNAILPAFFPFAVLRDTNTSIGVDGNYVRAAAGCSWDELVSFAIRSGLYGLENLSGIPGRVGAAPIQNIGAYGAQLADTLVEVTVFDGLAQRYETMDISELGLGYRTSRFKKSSESHLVIVDVLLKLSGQFVPNIDYQGVAQSISVAPASGSNVTASEVRRAVLKLRANKLPNPDKAGNVGSFFQNPVVTDAEARRLSKLGLQIWEGSAGTKISAAQLIEQSGLKGQSIGGARVSKRHSLVLENAGDATYQDVVQLMRHVQDTVFQRFGVSLTPEPYIFPVDL